MFGIPANPLKTGGLPNPIGKRGQLMVGNRCKHVHVRRVDVDRHPLPDPSHRFLHRSFDLSPATGQRLIVPVNALIIMVSLPHNSL